MIVKSKSWWYDDAIYIYGVCSNNDDGLVFYSFAKLNSILNCFQIKYKNNQESEIDIQTTEIRRE